MIIPLLFLFAVSWRAPAGWMKSTASSLATPPAWQQRRETPRWVSFPGDVLQGASANLKINHPMSRVNLKCVDPGKRWQSQKRIVFFGVGLLLFSALRWHEPLILSLFLRWPIQYELTRHVIAAAAGWCLRSLEQYRRLEQSINQSINFCTF